MSWTIDRRDHDGAALRVRDEAGKPVAEGWWQGRQEEYARLIVAAPDLLAALEAMVNDAVRLCESGDAGNYDVEQQPEIIQARAAISRARGKAP